MIIPRTFKQFIGGAISRRDREDYESGEVCEGPNEQTSIQPIISDENPIPSATTPRCCRSRWSIGSRSLFKTARRASNESADSAGAR